VAFTVEYYHRRVLATIEAWPVEVVADYARLVELLGARPRRRHAALPRHGPRALRVEAARTIRRRSCALLLRPDRRIVIVHAFLKKTRTTPGRDLAIARQRVKEIQRG
jgi:phage-related protein